MIGEADLAFPIILSADGRVIDGMHRLLKALLNGRRASRQSDSSVTPNQTLSMLLSTICRNAKRAALVRRID